MVLTVVGKICGFSNRTFAKRSHLPRAARMFFSIQVQRPAMEVAVDGLTMDRGIVGSVV